MPYNDRVEVQLQSVRLGSPNQRAVVIVAPRDPTDGCPLWIDVGDREAQALTCEMRGEETSRTQALALSGRIAEALQGALAGGVLICCSTGFLRAAIQVRTSDRTIEVPTEPGHALAAAAWLHLPLLADRRLFERAPAPALSAPVAAFLNTLDLGGLEAQ